MNESQRTARVAGWTWLVAAILFGAFMLRLWSINKESFWADEGWSVLLSGGASLRDVVLNMVGDQHPPLYFALLHYWRGLVGESELALRMLSLLWSVAGIALAYRFGADAFRSRGAGALAALVLALADNDIMMAQETRHYTQLTALALISGIFYLRYVRTPSRINGIGWFAASVALMYTHYLGAFILVVQGLHTLIIVLPLRRKVDLIVRLALVGFAWLPWAFVFQYQSSVRYLRPIIYRNSIPNSSETFITIRTDLFGAQFALMLGLLVLGLVTVVYRSGRARVRLRQSGEWVYLLAWFVVPIMVIVAVNSRVEILTPRNFLLVTPAIAILIGHGLMNLDRSARLFLIGVILFFGVTTVDSYFVKPPWRQVSQDVLAYRLDGEPVIMDVWVDDFALRYHLGRDLNMPPERLPLISIPEWLEKYTDQFHARLLDYVNQHEAVWLVQWSKDEAGIVNLLESHGFRRTVSLLETHLTTNVIQIWRYDRNPEEIALARFGEMLTLARAKYAATVPAGSMLPVGLWWTVAEAPSKDYSTSVFLLDSKGVLVAQQDGPPLGGKAPMSGWKVGELRFDQPKIVIPAGLAVGMYTLGVKVYFYADGAPLMAAQGSKRSDYLTLGTVQVMNGDTRR